MFQMDLFSIYLHMHSITASSELIVLLISVQLAGASVQHFCSRPGGYFHKDNSDWSVVLGRS